MLKINEDTENKFISMFNTKSGYYLRTGILEDGVDTGIEPFMASFPELLDIGVMGHCTHGREGLCVKSGVQCYQNGYGVNEPNMKLSDFRRIVDECKGKTFQFALGGRGDVDQHEDFEEILKYCSENDIVPNFTTSGLGLTDEKVEVCKKYCGAVAVSMYSRLKDLIPDIAIRRIESENDYKVYRDETEIPVKFTLGNINEDCTWDAPIYKINGKEYDWDELHHIEYSDKPQKYELYKVYNERIMEDNYTMKAIKRLIEAEVKTNIHFVLGKNTIDEAIIRLENGGFPKGINAVIFLLHKPVGLGQEDNVLVIEDKRLKYLMSLIDNNDFDFKIGFDSCTVPGLINMTNKIDVNSFDTCEAGRWSAYITSNMEMLPCSFDNRDLKWAYDISNDSIKNAWDSDKFNEFRSHFKNSCKSCKDRHLCMGGCPIKRQIVLCNRHEKDLV